MNSPLIKKCIFLISLFLAGAALAQETAPPPSPNANRPIVPESANSRKARTILEQMIQAMGGQKYLDIQTIEQEGRSYSYYNNAPTSMGTVFWAFYKLPDKARLELTKQRDVVYIYVGDKGYEKTYKGVAAMDKDNLDNYVRQHLHSMEYVIHVWLPDPTTALFYDGPAIAEQKPCDSVTLMNAKNDSVTLFINTENHLPVKKTFQWRDPIDNLKNVEGETYDNWRLEQGVPTPHTILRSHNGDTTTEKFLTAVKYNTPMADAMFEASVTYDPSKDIKPKK